ncbi:MAG: hypothetical protein ACI9WU_000640, partial [Myxococcota bacterium]
FDEALALAGQTAGPNKPMIRAARRYEKKNPGFAIEVGMVALHWMVEGYGSTLKCHPRTGCLHAHVASRRARGGSKRRP